MSDDYFPERPPSYPTIYAYEDTNPQYDGLLKVGYTTKDVRERVAQQYPTSRPGKPPYRIVLEEPAMRPDGTAFSDHEVHRELRRRGVQNPKGEWFACGVQKVQAVLNDLRDRRTGVSDRDQAFAMRPEQAEAVTHTAAYFRARQAEDPDRPPHFLWNAKMRFGKTFAAYQLALEMGWKRLLVLTFKPAVQSAWEDDLTRHVDFEGWQFVRPGGMTYEELDKKRPFVCFGSFQDYLGRNKQTGGIKTKNEWVHTTHWDCVILDEYHFGAWRERAKDLFEGEEKKEAEAQTGKGIDDFDEDTMPITTDAYLYLSGTPFRAMASGEFIEEQIYNWTYTDEQREKAQWTGPNNPYAALPQMVLMTYQLPESIRQIALQGEYNEFDLNTFFLADGEGPLAVFRHAEEVQKWLDIIRGASSITTVDRLKMGAKKPPLPFSDRRLLGTLAHTFWFLPNIAACHAMYNLLQEAQNRFFHQYEVIIAAGTDAGIGAKALPPVEKAMGDPLKTKSITLSCGKLTTGVTVKPWSGIFMLRNCSSPETYFQAAFRVQSPWTVRNPDGDDPNRDQILKEVCYVFDFAPTRALRQISQYSCELSVDDASPERRVAEFISFLPVLAYDGSSMKQLDAAGVLDLAMSGTTATLLARRWQHTLLVNVDNGTLQRLMNNPEAMKALQAIEGFRSLNHDIETIINKSEAVKQARRERNDEDMTPKEKKELTEAEKEFKSKRKEIQDKLIKFATRIPIFMYLTDFREHKLEDVIMELEPGLFRRVTGLTKKDFSLLVGLGVFNRSAMNEAVYSFKRYEDASLAYVGVNKHEGEDVGGWDTTLTQADFKKVFEESPAYLSPDQFS